MNRTFPCAYCATAGTKLNDANDQIRTQADSSFSNLNSTKQQIDKNILQVQNQISNVSTKAADLLQV